MNSDEGIIEAADAHFREDRLLQAARLLRQLRDKTLLTPNHAWILKKATALDMIVEQLTAAPGDDWNKLGESHGHRDTMIYYQMNGNKLTARLETPIEPNLLVPLLSVFNESSLYSTWLPRWERPMKVGVRESDLLRQSGRCGQLIKIVCDCPWPLSTREVIIDVVAVDDIDENGSIVVKMENGDPEDKDVPPKKENRTRVDFDGGILFRKCPADHPAFINSKKNHEGDMVLVCLTMQVDPHVAFIPTAMINFVTKSVLGQMWAQLLTVAEEVLDGKRPQHADSIKEKGELYDWIDQRAQVILQGLAISKKSPAALDKEVSTLLTEML